MKGPLLSFRSNAIEGPDDEPPTNPEDQIDAFTDEILASITLEEHDRLEARGNLEAVNRSAKIVALYLARFWHFQSPWWADEAMRKVFSDGLTVTRATVIAHEHAAVLRLADEGQNKRDFLRQHWEDHTFFQVATMRTAGVSAKEASQHAARWRDEFSDGGSSVMASTIERGFPAWASDPLRGKVWCRLLSREMSELTASEKSDLIQSNKLRALMLPSCPEGLQGERH